MDVLHRPRRLSAIAQAYQRPAPPTALPAPVPVPQQQYLQQQQPAMANQQPSTALTGYEPLDVIGNGTFGIIRKVRRRSDGRHFARKELNYDRMSDRDRKQIVAEVNILRTLEHDNIVKYEERFVDRDHGILYIVMEYCEGGDLGSVIKRCRRSDTYLQEETIWCFLAQMTRALDACHYRGVPAESPPPRDECSPLYHTVELTDRPSVDPAAAATAAAATAAGSPHQAGLAVLHRDLKPENVFLDAEGNIKLGDFGLSKQVGTAELARTYVGTPYYMSPELTTGSPYDAKSDIWALGCIVYELCAHKPPFDASNQTELTMKIKAGDIAHLPHQYSRELNNVVRAMLSQNPRDRPTTRQLLQVYHIQLSLRHLDVNAMARRLVAQRDELQRATLELQTALQEQQEELSTREAECQARLADIEAREAALQASPSSIAEAERRQFEAQVAELDARQSELDQRLVEIQEREAKLGAEKEETEQRRADLEFKYLDWYNGARKEADEILRNNEERERGLRARREERERRRATRKSGVTNTSSSVGDATSEGVRSGRPSGSSEHINGADASAHALATSQSRSADGTHQQASSNVAPRARRPPKATILRAVDTTGSGEMSYTSSSRYFNTTAQSNVGGASHRLVPSASAQNMRVLPSRGNVLPARRVVSGPRASRVVHIAPVALAEQSGSVMMMDVDASGVGNTSGIGPSIHHALVRDRVLGGHPVGSPRSVLRGDSSIRLRTVRSSAMRLSGLLGNGSEQVVVEMDQSPAPAPPANAGVRPARMIKASRVSLAVQRLQEAAGSDGEQGGSSPGSGSHSSKTEKKHSSSSGGSDDWVDQEGGESGGSARASTSPSGLAKNGAVVGTSDKERQRRGSSSGQSTGVDLRAWRGARADETDLEDESADDRRQANGFDSDVAMDSPLPVRVRQAAWRASNAPQQQKHHRSDEPSPSVRDDGRDRPSSDGVLHSPATRLPLQFDRLQLSSEDGQGHTPPVAPGNDVLGSAAMASPVSVAQRRVRHSTGPQRVAAASSLFDGDEDLPSPFIKRVNRINGSDSGSGSTSSSAKAHSSSTSTSSGETITSSAVPSSDAPTSAGSSSLATVNKTNGAGNSSGAMPMRSNSSHNLLVKAVKGSATAALKAAEERKAAAATAAATAVASAAPASSAMDDVRARRAEIENVRPSVGGAGSIYPSLPVLSTVGTGTTSSSATSSSATRARTTLASQAAATGPSTSSTAQGGGGGAARASASGGLSSRPSSAISRRLSMAGANAGGSAGSTTAAGAPSSRVLATATSANTAASNGTTASAAAASGLPSSKSSNIFTSAARGATSSSTTSTTATKPLSAAVSCATTGGGLGGTAGLIPGVGRRRSMAPLRRES